MSSSRTLKVTNYIIADEDDSFLSGNHKPEDAVLYTRLSDVSLSRWTNDFMTVVDPVHSNFLSSVDLWIFYHKVK